MTRKEIIPLQKELTNLVGEFGQAGHDKLGGPSVHYVRKSIYDAVPNEKKLIECLEYFRGLKEKSDKEAEIEKAKSEILK